jgi:hypothetical protein
MRTPKETIQLLEDLALGLIALDEAWDSAIESIESTETI